MLSKIETIFFELILIILFFKLKWSTKNNVVNYSNIMTALTLNLIYFTSAVIIFYAAFNAARKRGTLVNIGE